MRSSRLPERSEMRMKRVRRRIRESLKKHQLRGIGVRKVDISLLMIAEDEDGAGER
jgi:hypothetical protein